MRGTKGQGGISCCGIFDCVETTVAYLGQSNGIAYLYVGEHYLEIPAKWVHPSQDSHSYRCFVPTSIIREDGQSEVLSYIDEKGRKRAIPPEIPTAENTRCVFYRSAM